MHNNCCTTALVHFAPAELASEEVRTRCRGGPDGAGQLVSGVCTGLGSGNGSGLALAGQVTAYRMPWTPTAATAPAEQHGPGAQVGGQLGPGAVGLEGELDRLQSAGPGVPDPPGQPACSQTAQASPSVAPTSPRRAKKKATSPGHQTGSTGDQQEEPVRANQRLGVTDDQVELVSRWARTAGAARGAPTADPAVRLRTRAAR